MIFIPFCGRDNADKAKIRLAYLQGDLHQLACWAALERNFFAEEGLDVEVAGIFKAGPEEMSAFSAGSLDVGYVGQAPATTAVANKTADVVVIAQANREGSAVVVGVNSGISKFDGLAGGTIAIPGHSTVQEFLLRKAMLRYGLMEGSVKLIVLKPPEMISALGSGQVDAFIAWEPYPSRAMAMKTGKILTGSKDIWKGHPCCVLVADARFLRENPEKARGIVRAHVKATNFINHNFNEAVKIAVKYSGMDEATVSASINNIIYDYIPEEKGEIEYVDFLKKLGYIKVGDSAAFTATFIDANIIKEIKKR